MHLVSINQAGSVPAMCEPGEYVLDTETANYFETQGWGKKVRRLLLPENPYVPGEPVLLFRTAGFGDLIMLTPVLCSLSVRLNSHPVTVACWPRFSPALQNLPYVRTIAYPLTVEQVGRYHNVLDLNGRLPATHHPALDWSALAGVSLPPGWRPDYAVTRDERSAVRKHFPTGYGEKRMAIQVAASRLSRSWPVQHLHRLVNLLVLDGWRIFLLGEPHQLPENGGTPEVIDLTNHGLSFRESAAVLASCDACVCPDSGLLHVAAALGIPTVGLFGPIDYRARLGDYASVAPIQGPTECSACGHDAEGWPAGMPCEASNRCEALAAITPESVVRQLAALTKRKLDA